MQRLVNHIYWANGEIFTAGSLIRVSKKLKVNWSNSLMSPGRPVISWTSSYNYQASRIEPQLPILKNGNHYRIYAHITSKPLHAYLVRMSFFDLQGTEIKRVEFRSQQKSFVFPDDAVTYRISIINSGMTSMQFDRIDICDDNMPKAVHDEIWVHRPIHQNSTQPLNIFLVHDGKQSRKTYPILDEMAPMLPIQLISIGWQYEEDFSTWLKQWLAKQKLTKFHLISTDPSLDQLVWEIHQHYHDSEIMLSRPRHEGLLNYLVWNYAPKSWESPNIVEPNWQKIVKTMNGSWGWRFVYDV